MMNIESGEGVAIELMIPFEWEVLSDDRTCLHHSTANINTLLLFESQQELSHRQQDESTLSGSDVERLESKLNLLIELMNQLIEANKPLPKKHEVVLSSQSLSWASETALEMDEIVLLTLYPDPSISQPIKLCAKISEKKDNRVKAVFISLDGQEEEMLSKWIFRLHRRSIAMSKQR